jgi:hypothetical protein
MSTYLVTILHSSSNSPLNHNANRQKMIIQTDSKENQGESSGGILPAPKELFEMKDPGLYTMEIEMQMFRYVATRDTDVWFRNLLCFSPIRIKVENPPEAKTKLNSTRQP